MRISISKPQCYSAVGQKANQEDSLYPLEGQALDSGRVFMVCDGMGGHEKGEVASACVAETIGNATDHHPDYSVEQMKQCFEEALQMAYHNLDELDDTESYKKMGTTLTFIAFCTDGVLVAHIGDSRVYHLRPSKGILFHTRDHSLVNDLIAAGELKPEEARTFPQRNVITRAVQPHQEYPARASYKVLTDIRQGDLFFLCCDGVLEQIEDDELARILLQDAPLGDRVGYIENVCKERNTRDNNTCYLLEVADVKGIDSVLLTEVDSACNAATGSSASVANQTSPSRSASSSQSVSYTTPARGRNQSSKSRSYVLWTAVVLIFAALGIGVYLLCSSSKSPSSGESQNSTQIGGTQKSDEQNSEEQRTEGTVSRQKNGSQPVEKGKKVNPGKDEKNQNANKENSSKKDGKQDGSAVPASNDSESSSVAPSASNKEDGSTMPSSSEKQNGTESSGKVETSSHDDANESADPQTSNEQKPKSTTRSIARIQNGTR